MNRRKFLYNLTLSGAAIYVSGYSNSLFGMDKGEITKLTILHTNDVHSRLDPFPVDGTKYQGLGGVTRRAALIKKIREEQKNILLFDCGDIVQGTPYFNMFGGKPEYEMMNAMKYDASTLGNHDFDSGIQGLADLQKMATFAMINCNYDLKNTPMNGLTVPYRIFEKDGIKVGVYGVGIDLKGLVTDKQTGNMVYHDPIEMGNAAAKVLKHDMKCNLVVCLSHLGYKYRDNKVSDIIMAQNSKDVDIILGGHTHTFLDKPDLIKNQEGEMVMVNQVGWAGIRLGRIDITFEKGGKNSCVACDNMWVRN